MLKNRKESMEKKKSNLSYFIKTGLLGKFQIILTEFGKNNFEVLGIPRRN